MFLLIPAAPASAGSVETNSPSATFAASPEARTSGPQRPVWPRSADRFCADRCAAPVVGLTCGLTHIVDPPSFRAVAIPCVMDIQAIGEPGGLFFD
ncbi:hypothetical protein [Phreatobacter stygius]|uniref:Uncharacterized protein n=1 Tax=Phreatobacter stygius TaxID=1940610 RepID=A0A4D7BGG8_9HYPH|nr:hypothetical protein [Phreatobacter stygius]QCI68256.1 hypothetical protein E8M01_30945 [Phreatobacter stygius]